jgi:hypothetical protein
MKQFIERYIEHLKKVWPILLFIGLALGLLISCADNVKRSETGHTIYGSPISVLEIEGCEYLEFSNGARTHKGNCNNPIHKCTCTCEVEEEEEETQDATSTLLSAKK